MSDEHGFRYHAGLTAAPPARPVLLPFGRCLLALEEGQVTMRDLDILAELAYSQYLTRLQIQDLAMQGVSKSVIRRRLEVLSYLGLVSAIRWEEPRPDNTPLHRVAYCLALNGAKVLRHYHGRTLPWHPGMAQRHLRRVMAILAANEFRIEAMAQRPDLLEDWHVLNHPVGPVAKFRLGEQLVLMEAPRDEEDAAQMSPKNYARWTEQTPMVFVLAPNEATASAVFQRLKGTFPPDRMLFSTDERAFGSAVDAPGFMWQWEESGQAQALALA